WFTSRGRPTLVLPVGDSLPLPMARVDALLPAKIGASTRFSDADRDRSQAQKVEWLTIDWHVADTVGFHRLQGLSQSNRSRTSQTDPAQVQYTVSDGSVLTATP